MKKFTPKVIILMLVVSGIATVSITTTLAQAGEAASSTEITDQQVVSTSTSTSGVSAQNSDVLIQATSTQETTPTEQEILPPGAEANPEVQTLSQTGTSPLSLTKVNIVGTKFIDYFTDGKTEYSFPSDPEVVANFAKPNSAIPVHGDLQWTGTRGYPRYDTPSSDLEENQYAQQSDGTYVIHYPPMTYTSATTTATHFVSKIVTTQVDPSAHILEGFSATAH